MNARPRQHEFRSSWSISRPGAEKTGINVFTLELAAKRVELLRELVPGAARMAVLVTASAAETTVRDVEAAARALGLQIQSGEAIDMSTRLIRRGSGLGTSEKVVRVIGGDPFSARVAASTSLSGGGIGGSRTGSYER